MERPFVHSGSGFDAEDCAEAGQPLPDSLNTPISPSVASAADIDSPCDVNPSGGTLGSLQSDGGMVDPKPDGHENPVIPVGRRAAPRLRISLPGQLIAVEKAHSCILMNLSRTGAQVAILDSVRKNEGVILRCGVINHFAIVTRSEFGLNALEFDEPLTDDIVLEIRRYHENFEERERRALIETARKWVTGDSEDERPI